MGYRIIYGTVEKKRKNKLWYWTVALVLFIVIGKATGADHWAGELLLPGDPAVTASALDHALEQMGQGQSIPSVFTSFFQEVIAGAQVY